MHMQTPSTQLLSFFRAHGMPSASTSLQVQSRSDDFITRATEIAERLDAGNPSALVRLGRIDDIVAMCTGAIYAAHGFELKDTEGSLKSPLALEALAAELSLSLESAAPLRQVRTRVAEFGIAANVQGSDAFLAHQGAFLSTGLVLWATELVEDIRAH
jgi:histidine ammonia-lyase